MNVSLRAMNNVRKLYTSMQERRVNLPAYAMGVNVNVLRDLLELDGIYSKHGYINTDMIVKKKLLSYTEISTLIKIGKMTNEEQIFETVLESFSKIFYSAYSIWRATHSDFTPIIVNSSGAISGSYAGNIMEVERIFNSKDTKLSYTKYLELSNFTKIVYQI